MKRKIKSKLVLVNTGIVILCMSAFSFFIYLFVKDVNSSSVRADKDEVATISFKYKIAQRKYADRVVWEPLKNDSPLYDGDTIRTSDLSEAKISFSNDVSVEVGENTMFRISYSSDGQLQVLVDDGSISIDTTSSNESILLQMEGVNVNLESGSRVVAKTESASTNENFASSDRTSDDVSGKSSGSAGQKISSFQMLSGNASVKTQEGQVATVKTGESLKLEDNGTLTKNPITVTSIPNSHRVLIFEDLLDSSDKKTDAKKAFVKLEWTLPNSLSSDVVVQTSKSRNFEKDVQSQIVHGFSYLLPVDEGITYWKIFEKNNENLYTEGKIIAEVASCVSSTLPKNDENFFFHSQKPNVSFSWTGNNYVSSYKVEICENPNFENPIVSEIVQTRRFSTQLDEGTYFWRVTPFYEINGTGFYKPTESRSFTIAKRSEWEKPKMILPQENALFYYDSQVLPIAFSWESEIPNGSYKILVAEDKNFSKKVAEFETQKKVFDAQFDTEILEKYENETLYCKIIQSYIDEDGSECKIESETRSFSFEKYVPEKSRLLYPSDGFSLEEEFLEKTTFMWCDETKSDDSTSRTDGTSPDGKNLSGGKNLSDANAKPSLVCKFQISSSEDFSKIVFESPCKENKISSIKLNQGNYWWHVIDKGGNITDARKIVVLPHLASPEFLYPKNEQKIVVSENKSFEIKWRAIESCDYYKVSLIDLENESTIAERFVPNNSYSFIPENLTENNFSQYKICVQGFVSETKTNPLRIGEVGEFNFSLRLPSCIVLDEVKNGTQISGLKAIREETVFSWHSGIDEVSETEFLLYSVNARGVEKLFYSEKIRNEKNSKDNIKMNRLAPGLYRWTVCAIGQNGEILDAKAINEFMVTNVPLLETSFGKFPTQNFVIGPDYLRKNRAINFEWTKVLGATDYKFVLYQKNSDGTMKKIYEQENLTSTQLRFKNLSALDVGNFVWTVTSYSHAKDGFTEQYSQESENYFSIDFSLPKKIETVTPGIMYGE